MGIFFLTAIEFLLTAINQGTLLKVYNISWLAVVGACFVGLWVVFIYSYPLTELSYVAMIKKRREKFTYVMLFIFLVFWGMLLAFVPGIVSYFVLIVWSLFWLYLTIKNKFIGRESIKFVNSI